MRDIFFALIFLGAIPVGLLSAHLAVTYWYWISYFQPHTQSFGFAIGLPYGPVAAGIALLSWLISRERKLPPAIPLVVLLIVEAIWISFTTLIAQYPTPAAAKWDVTIKSILMTILGIMVIQNKSRLDILIWAICIAVGYYGFKLGLFSLSGGSGSSFRGPSYMNDNNNLARGMIMTIPLLIYLFLQYKQLWVRAGVGAVALSSTVALVFSGSRGAWVATLVAAAFVGLRMKRGLLIMCLMGAAGLLIIPLLPEQIINRFLSIGDLDTDASFQGRVGAWRYGLELFLQRPITGGGFGIFDHGYGKASHNSFMQMLGEHGLVGLVILISLLLACASATRWIRRVTKFRPDLAWASQLAFMLQVILVAYTVGSLTINHAFFPLLYGLFGILASLQIIVRRELQSSSVTQPAPIAPPVAGLQPVRRY